MTMTSDTAGTPGDQARLGNVLLAEDRLMVVTKVTDDGQVIVKEMGDRRMSPSAVPTPGDDCPNPTCEGVVQDGDLGKRFCSQGCLEWLTCFKDDGQDCDKWAAHDCDGNIVHEDAPEGNYRYSCTECDCRGAGVKQWREAWWPRAEENAVEAFKDEFENGVASS